MFDAVQMKRPSLAAAISVTALTFVLLLPAIAANPFALVNMAMLYGLAWWGWANLPMSATKELEQNAIPKADRVPADLDPLDGVHRDIKRATRLADSPEAIQAIDRFKRLLFSMTDQDFDDHHAVELDGIVERDFPDLIRRYASAKARVGDSEDLEADRILAGSLQRLTRRMEQISTMQTRLHTDQLRQHDDYLRSKHPVDNDPFDSTGGLS